MDEISENIFNEELDKLLLVKLQFRENYIWMSTTWRSKIQSEGIRNTHYSSHNESMKLKDNNYWKPNRASSTREYICVADWGWRTIFIKKAMQEIAKNWRIKKKLLSRGNTETQWRLEEFPMQHDQESRTVNLFFYDPDLLSSKDGPTFLIKLLILRVPESIAAKLECREIHERVWVFLDTFLIVNMLDEILKNYIIIQEIWQHHRESLTMSTTLRKEGIEKSGSEEPLQSIPLSSFSVRAKRKSLDDK